MSKVIFFFVLLFVAAMSVSASMAETLRLDPIGLQLTKPDAWHIFSYGPSFKNVSLPKLKDERLA